MRERLRFCLLVASVVGGFAWSGAASAAEISMLSGLYRQNKDKVEGKDAGDSSEIKLGGRYADEYDVGMNWFGEATIAMRSYDAPSGVPSPSDSTSIDLGGGLRMYFDPFSQSITPFMYGKLAYVMDKTANVSAMTETEVNGLFYSMHTGVRFAYDQNLFLDLELPLFTSALNATTTTETQELDGNGDWQKTKRESTRTELYVDAQEPFSAIQVVIGLKI